jgi:hypothetical protein
MNKTEILNLLNAPCAEQRLENLKNLVKSEPAPTLRPEFANNHIHTTYSFSPYTPTAAVWFAREAGLGTAGIMDHDSIGGAEEFRAAGAISGIGTTCGMECRVSMKGTPFADKKLNSPDQAGVAYMAIHSVPAASFDMMQKAFAPLREKRNARNKLMVDKINEIVAPSGIVLDFEKDVVPLSMFDCGGSVTERHLLAALAHKIIATVGEEGVAEFLTDKLGLTLSARQLEWMRQRDPLCFSYDILGVLKSSLNARTFIPADEELLTLAEVVELADRAGAILCYAYLGDVGDSPTGDKKAEKFEDSYLDELFAFLAQAGVHGVTYMPSRNTRAQMERLMALCREFGMTEISGEDINQPRQSFICQQLSDPMFAHLVDMAWKLVEREK